MTLRKDDGKEVHMNKEMLCELELDLFEGEGGGAWNSGFRHFCGAAALECAWEVLPDWGCVCKCVHLGNAGVDLYRGDGGEGVGVR